VDDQTRVSALLWGLVGALALAASVTLTLSSPGASFLGGALALVLIYMFVFDRL
jgi:hypothetical protein